MQDKTYLILPGCDDTNRGDQALIWETIAVAKEAGYNGKYYILADADKAIQSAQRGIGHMDYILPHPSTHFHRGDNIQYTLALKLKWALAAGWDLLSCVPLLSPMLRKLLLPLYKKATKDTLHHYEAAEASFVKGGGFLHAYGGVTESYKIIYFLYHIRLALSYGHDVYVMPNSFGPFRGPFVAKMIQKTLSKCKMVMSRERISHKQLLEVCNIQSEVHPDLAFFLKRDADFDARKALINAGVPIGEKPCVALTMRPYRFPGESNPLELYHRYQEALAAFICWLSDRGYYPVLVEHVACDMEHESDMSCITDVTALLGGKCSYCVFSDPTLTCEQMKGIYGCFDYTIGTRFHSVIFSLAENVPSMSITYGGNKGDGIMKDLQLNRYAIPIHAISLDALTEKFTTLEKNRDELRQRLFLFQNQLSEEKERIIAQIRKENEKCQH